MIRAPAWLRARPRRSPALALLSVDARPEPNDGAGASPPGRTRPGTHPAEGFSRRRSCCDACPSAGLAPGLCVHAGTAVVACPHGGRHRSSGRGRGRHRDRCPWTPIDCQPGQRGGLAPPSPGAEVTEGPPRERSSASARECSTHREHVGGHCRDLTWDLTFSHRRLIMPRVGESTAR